MEYVKYEIKSDNMWIHGSIGRLTKVDLVYGIISKANWLKTKLFDNPYDICF